MPRIRYTLREGEDTFSEEDYFEPTNDPVALVNEKVLSVLNKRREETGEPLLTLESAVVTNPNVHLHSWFKTSLDRTNLRVHHVCLRCGITGRRAYNVVHGEYKGEITRDEKFAKDKYLLCRDALKELPKKLNF